MDEGIKVFEYIKNTCEGAKVIKIVRYEKGKSIEKIEDNFAEETALMLK